MRSVAFWAVHEDPLVVCLGWVDATAYGAQLPRQETNEGGTKKRVSKAQKRRAWPDREWLRSVASRGLLTEIYSYSSVSSSPTTVLVPNRKNKIYSKNASLGYTQRGLINQCFDRDSFCLQKQFRNQKGNLETDGLENACAVSFITYFSELSSTSSAKYLRERHPQGSQFPMVTKALPQ